MRPINHYDKIIHNQLIDQLTMSLHNRVDTEIYDTLSRVLFDTLVWNVRSPLHIQNRNYLIPAAGF